MAPACSPAGESDDFCPQPLITKMLLATAVNTANDLSMVSNSIFLVLDACAKHSKWMRFLSALCCLSLSGCALFGSQTSFQSSADSLSPPTHHVQVVSYGSADNAAEGSGQQHIPDAAMIQGLAALELAIADYPLPGTVQQRWSFRASGIELLAQQGYADQAREQLHELQADVALTSQDYYQRHANQYLQQAQQFAFLSSEQYGRLRAAQLSAYQADYKTAYLDARSLVRELWSADGWVTARSGDTLAKISARPQVYDNANLWPLLKAANKALFYNDQALRSGWRLRYPLHPRLDEIFAAVEGAF